MLAKCVLTILELNWNQRFRGNNTKLNICHHMLTSSTQLQNRSFHVVERTRTSARCPKIKNARAKRAKPLFFVVKYANLPSSSRLLKLPNREICILAYLITHPCLSFLIVAYSLLITYVSYLFRHLSKRNLI